MTTFDSIPSTVLSDLIKKVHVPSPSEKIFKNECAYSFDTPEIQITEIPSSSDALGNAGIFINLKTFIGVSARYLATDSLTSSNRLYLRSIWIKVESEKSKTLREKQKNAPGKNPSLEDLINRGQAWEYQKYWYLTLLKDEKEVGNHQEQSKSLLSSSTETTLSKRQRLDSSTNGVVDVSSFIQASLHLGRGEEMNHTLTQAFSTQGISPDDIKTLGETLEAIINASDSSTEQRAALAFKHPDLKTSKFAKDLEQDLEKAAQTTISMDPNDWQVTELTLDGQERTMTKNLWLNLSDGHIGSGRRQYDGSGGENGALQHFEAMRKEGKNYPLVVKLGTINGADGTADVYSYHPDEDDMVFDPYLKEHLATWGIDLDSMKKSDASVAELELDLSLKLDLSRVTEEGEDCQRLYGPGMVGLKNLGNSCYMNTVMQVLFHLGEFQERYFDSGKALKRVFKQTHVKAVPSSIECQLCKLAEGLLSQRYTKPIVPWRLKVEEKRKEKEVSSALESKEEGVTKEKKESDNQHEKKNNEDSKTKEEEEILEDLESYVEPQSFKIAMADGNADYLGGQQQDASLYLLHVLDIIGRMEKRQKDLPKNGRTAELFHSSMEKRFDCLSDQTVIFKQDKGSNFLSLPIPLPSSSNSGSGLGSSGAGVTSSGDEKKDQEKVKISVPFEKCLQAYFSDEMVPDMYSPTQKRKCPHMLKTRFAKFPKYLVLVMRRYEFSYRTMGIEKIDALVKVPETLNLEEFRAKGKQEGDVLAEELAASSGSSASGGGSDQLEAQALQLCEIAGCDLDTAKTALDHCNGDANNAVMAIFSQQITPTMIDMFKIKQMEEAEAKAAEAKEEENEASEGDSNGSNSSSYDLVSFITHVGKNANSGHYICHIKDSTKGNCHQD